MNDIQAKALQIRREVLRMSVRANGGHIAPSYSIADILAELYFDNILRYDPANPSWPERDYFILSKGHGAPALYAALAMSGFFPMRRLDEFCRAGSELGSLARSGAVPGVEASTGSLGHGLSYGAGIALALKRDKASNHVFVLLGDGECEEGSVWEALMFSAHHQLDNMTIIIDNNNLQAMDTLSNIMSLDRFDDRLRSFGLSVTEIDGHNYDEISTSLRHNTPGRPSAVIAHTVKGKGISFMEGVPIWHYRVPKGEELDTALGELGMTREELGEYEDSILRHII